MSPFTFRCPTSAQIVQGFASDGAPAGDYFEAVECTACKRVHLVNPRTGKLVGEDKAAGETTSSAKQTVH
jgi:hypothetical protein